MGAYSALGSDLDLCYLPVAPCGDAKCLEPSVSPSVKWVWWINDDHTFFTTPPGVEGEVESNPPFESGLVLMT